MYLKNQEGRKRENWEGWIEMMEDRRPMMEDEITSNCWKKITANLEFTTEKKISSKN